MTPKLKHFGLICLVLLVLSSTIAIAQYQQATRFRYTVPRVKQYPTQPCITVVADQDSVACFRDAVLQCMRLNNGKCYNDCERHVRNICMDTKRVPDCLTDTGFEKVFPSIRDCLINVERYCEQRCVDPRDNWTCRSRMSTRCSYIGRLFV